MTAFVWALATIIVTILFSGLHLNYKMPKGFFLTGLIGPVLGLLYYISEINKHGAGGANGDIYFAWFASLPVQFIVSIIIASSISALFKLIS